MYFLSSPFPPAARAAAKTCPGDTVDCEWESAVLCMISPLCHASLALSSSVLQNLSWRGWDHPHSTVLPPRTCNAHLGPSGEAASWGIGAADNSILILRHLLPSGPPLQFPQGDSGGLLLHIPTSCRQTMLIWLNTMDRTYLALNLRYTMPCCVMCHVSVCAHCAVCL